MSSQDALTRLEKWLDHPNRYLLACWRTSDMASFVCRLSVTDRRIMEGQGSDLATAIHAALDRAEEQGL